MRVIRQLRVYGRGQRRCSDAVSYDSVMRTAPLLVLALLVTACTQTTPSQPGTATPSVTTRTNSTLNEPSSATLLPVDRDPPVSYPDRSGLESPPTLDQYDAAFRDLDDYLEAQPDFAFTKVKSPSVAGRKQRPQSSASPGISPTTANPSLPCFRSPSESSSARSPPPSCNFATAS